MNEPITIIGLSGRLVDANGLTVSTSRTGKGTAAKSLDLFHGFQVLGFADAMTDIIHRIGGRSGELYKHLAEPDAYRKLKMAFGTEARKDARCRSVWRDVAKVTIAAFARHCMPSARKTRFVLEDLRYTEEAADLKSLAEYFGGRFVLCEVRRPAPAGHQGIAHPSEKGLAVEPDHVIRNDEGVRELVHLADAFGQMVLDGFFDREGLPKLTPKKDEDDQSDVPF